MSKICPSCASILTTVQCALETVDELHAELQAMRKEMRL